MQKNSRLSINFFTRKQQKDSDILFIHARITYNGRRAELSLNRNVKTSLWDKSRKRGKGYSNYILSLNKYLDQVFTQLHESHKELLDQGKEVSAPTIRARYFGEVEQGKTLLDLISYHNKTMNSVLKGGTMKNYLSTERCIIRFLKEIYNTSDILLTKLNYAFISDFEQYIRTYKPTTRKGCTNNGTMKHLERLKKLSRLAVRMEWLDKDPFVNCKLRFIKTDREFLTERELKTIEDTTFKVPSTERIKDLFVFACYTGLSFVDVQELKSNQIVKGLDGSNWLYTRRTKTFEPVKIPLLPEAEEIIEKYKNCEDLLLADRLLPIYSNQMINRTLKDIAKVCGIHKKMTFHVARHTFATAITLSNGVPIETVSKLLGHTKLSTTQIYARVVEKKVGEDMRNLIVTRKQKRKKQTTANITA